MKLRLPRRRLWRAAIYLGSLLLVLIAIDLVLVQVNRTVHPGYLTTRIVEPKMSDGRVDYMIAIDHYFGRGVTPENNAAVILLRAVGPNGLSPKQPPNGVTQYMGMEPLPEKGDYFVAFDPSKTVGNEPATEPDVLESNNDTRWPIKISAARRASVAANERPLNLFIEGSRRTRFFIPFYAGYRPDTILETHLKHALLYRQISSELLTRAMIRLDAGDADGFRRDVVAVHRWTRLVSNSQTIIERLVAFRIETAACVCDRVAINSGKLKPDDIRALADDLAKLEDLHTTLDAVDCGERYMALDLLQWMAQGGPSRVAFALDVMLPAAGMSKPALTTRIGAQFFPIDFDACMTRMNAYYDAALALARKPTWKERRDGIQLWEEGVSGIAKRNRLAVFFSSDWPAMILLPTLMHNVMQDESVRAQLRLARVSAGLAVFKSEHGTYPKSLAEIAPQILPEVPVDPFTEDSFKYSPKNDVYTLYSVGPNMIDDGMQKDDLNASMQSAVATSPTTSQ